MPFYTAPIDFLHYVLRREATQFFTSIAIRYLALGMVLIFEPIYLYIYFDKSLSLTLLFFAAIHGLFALLVVYGGRMMTKIGLKHVMLLSNFFFFGYFLTLFFIYNSFLLISLAILLRAVGMSLFWPAFHTDFLRFSEKGYRGRAVGKMNIACSAPTIISPIIGGWLLASFGYPALFATVLVVLFASAIPLFLSKEVHVVYSDSYRAAWRRIFKKRNRNISLSFIAHSIESGVIIYIWPIFMSILAISYVHMGEITTASLIVGALFMIYMGRLSDRIINRVRFLNIGSALTSIAWILKFFVTTPFTALLTHIIYRISRITAGIPFQSFLYTKASSRGAESDEFFVYREILINITRCFFFIALAILFFFVPQINLAFIVAAIASLCLMFLGVPPRILKKLRW
jgi:MFS family permease